MKATTYSFPCAFEMESLESRLLLSLTTPNAVADVNVVRSAAASQIDVSSVFSDTQTAVQIGVQYSTTVSTFDVLLYNTQTPLTVANFLTYVNSGAYNSTFVHRSVPGFVIQTGGYDASTGNHITTNAAVQNEPGISNTRGTIAMAKSASDPNSATSEWFVNLADNSANLDSQNGGFTVFGYVINGGMSVVDDIAALQVTDFSGGNTSSPFTNVPTWGSNYIVPMTATEIPVWAATGLSWITLSVAGNTNSALVTPSLSGGTLKLTYTAGVTGRSQITLRATDMMGDIQDDVINVYVRDPASDVVVTPTAGLTTTEAGGTATFTMKLATAPTANVTIGLSSSDLTEGTVGPVSVTFTPANYSTPQTVTVTGVNDSIIDGNIAYSIITAAAVSTDPYYSGMTVADVSLTNTDTTVAGITVTPTSGLSTTEAGGTATFTMKLNSQPTANVTIGVSSSDLTEGTVSAASVTFTPANWNTAQTVTVTGVDDSVVDGNIAYTIVTAAAVSTDTHYSGLNAADVAVTNTDNDVAGVTITPTSGLVTTEAGGTATFTVRLTSQPTANVSIGLASSDLTEGTVSAASLTFTAANWNTPQTVTVAGVDDYVVDGNVAYTIVTGAAVSTDTHYSGLNPADVAVTNTDNDVAGFTVTPTSGLVTTEAGGTATFTVRLTSQPTANVTLGLTSSDLTEGAVSAASLAFTSANWSTPQTVTVTGVGDTIVDGNIAYSIVTAAAVSTDTHYNGLNPADVAVTNTAFDVPGITVTPTTGLVTTEAGGKATFTLKLNSQPTADVIIGLTSNDTTEGKVSYSSVTFTAANWMMAKTVTVTGVNDYGVDGNIVYKIITAAAVSADTRYSGMNAADVTVTNMDNDVAGITVTPTSGLTTTEAGGTATFTVKLTSQPAANVTIGLTSSDLTEGTVSAASVTFTASTWNTPQTVTVTGVDDFVVDGNIAYIIVTAAAVSTDTHYNGLNPADVAVTNTDNDVAGFTVTPTSGLTTTEAGGKATFTVKLKSQPTANVAFSLSSSDTTEGTVGTTKLTFTPTNWNTAQTVTVTGVNDFVVDGNIAYRILTAPAVSTDTHYNGQNPADVAVTNTDNDVVGITVTPTSGLTTTEAGGSATFTMKLTSQPAANVTIGLTSSDLTEGTVSVVSVTFTPTNWSTAQTVTVTGVDDLIVDGNIAYKVITAAAVSTDLTYNGLNAVDVALTNLDND